ncbi:40S ribosomal protein S12, partial [Elysia marginata]
MSDAEVEAPVAAAAPGEPMDVYQALQEVLKTALIHDGLCRGAKEAAKSLD